MVNEIVVSEKMTAADRLEKLGFKRASSQVRVLAERKRKMMIAYENFRFVTEKKVQEFNAKLRATARNTRIAYNELYFTDVQAYEGVPPGHVLQAMEEAMNLGCFDKFEIAAIREVKDPILFGRITGCGDRFYIAQWDDDVKIEDILKPNEG